VIQSFLEEVQRRADDRTADLLPAVMQNMLKRNSLHGCVRHDVYLSPYVEAQILLTRANRYFHWHDTDRALRNYVRARANREEARRKYRATPCTCWVPKR
jgi:hypothetical protein